MSDFNLRFLELELRLRKMEFITWLLAMVLGVKR